MTRALLLLVVGCIVADASFVSPIAPSARDRRCITLRPAAAVQRPVRHYFIAMEDSDGDVNAAAAEPAPEASSEVVGDSEEGGSAEAQTGGQAAAAAADDDDEEDDLLNSPAFLKQKIKVLEKELASVRAESEGLDAQIEETKQEWSQKRDRLQADFDNFKARAYNQTLDAQADSKVQVVNQLLPVLDNFDRARAAIKVEGEAETAINARYEEMNAGLMAALTELGVEKIATLGEEFDYNVHMAIQQAPSDEYDENIVCSELQPGYTIRGKLVRPAYVIVSSG